MTESERLDYLIKVLCGNDARDFALKAGIRPDILSRVRNGKGNPSFYFERILGAFPQVSREWLYSGDGFPTVEQKEKTEILAKIESLENEVRQLRELMEQIADRICG